MTTEHHDLLHEFPQHRDQIHELKTSDRHFRKLFDQYHDLTKDIENMEAKVNPVSTKTEENAKIQRVHLKDQLYKMLADWDLGAIGLWDISEAVAYAETLWLMWRRYGLFEITVAWQRQLISIWN